MEKNIVGLSDDRVLDSNYVEHDDKYLDDVIEEINESLGNIRDYSTTEKIVGKWIDGKNIYKKTIQGTVTGWTLDTSKNLGYFDVSLTNLNIDLPIFHFCTFDAIHLGKITLPFHTLEGTSIAKSLSQFSKTFFRISTEKTAEMGSNRSFWATIFYTKTTE